MKIYEINGRKVWLDKAPEGYEEPKKAEIKVEPKTEPEPVPVKVKKATSNKARKSGGNK